MGVLKKDMVKGNLKPGEKMPSGRDLSLAMTINPNTAARVYRELEQEGYCFTKRGLGTFVTEDEEVLLNLKKDMAKETIDKFVDEILSMGMTLDEALGMVKRRRYEKCC